MMATQLSACRHLKIGGQHSTHYYVCQLSGKAVDCIGLISRCECPELRACHDRWAPTGAPYKMEPFAGRVGA